MVQIQSIDALPAQDPFPREFFASVPASILVEAKHDHLSLHPAPLYAHPEDGAGPRIPAVNSDKAANAAEVEMS
jgi:hypothetical protein